MRRGAWVLGLLLAGSGRASWAEPTAFPEANAGFHQDYNALKDRTLEGFGAPGQPVLVRLDDDLVVLRDSTRTVVRILPPLYHRLKAVSHVPFGVYLALKAQGEGPLSEDGREALEGDRARAEEARAAVESEFPKELRERQENILSRALGCVEAALKSGRVDPKGLRSCSRDLVVLLDANEADAARLELDALHAAMTKLRASMSEGDWGKLLVVVCASHQPRHLNVSLQYFLRLFGEREGPGAQEEKRVVYAEGVLDEDRALDLLAKHVLDRDAGEAFFGEPGRLQRDLLGDAAAAYLDKLLPPKP